jgi:hypothetical protein
VIPSVWKRSLVGGKFQFLNFRNFLDGLVESRIFYFRLVSHEGRLAIVTDAGRDAVDVDAPLTNGAEADGEVVWS